jgi:hypothetical protein
MEALFEQTVRARWINASEANHLNWLGAAVRATTTPTRDPVRVFVSIVKRRDWHLITNAHEERARLASQRFRGYVIPKD